MTVKPPKSPRLIRIARTVRVAEVTTPGGSDETAVDEEAETTEIGCLDDDLDEAAKAPLKRAREEKDGKSELHFNFKPETEERKIATIKWVSRFHLEPWRKLFAWGVATFVIGMDAIFPSRTSVSI
ncbi:hypothetical protein V8B97DRAFT_2006377 [Scleroderma yunnanense]